MSLRHNTRTRTFHYEPHAVALVRALQRAGVTARWPQLRASRGEERLWLADSLTSRGGTVAAVSPRAKWRAVHHRASLCRRSGHGPQRLVRARAPVHPFAVRKRLACEGLPQSSCCASPRVDGTRPSVTTTAEVPLAVDERWDARPIAPRPILETPCSRAFLRPLRSNAARPRVYLRCQARAYGVSLHPWREPAAAGMHDCCFTRAN